MAVETRHLECASRLEAGSGETEPTAIGEPRACLDQDAESGRVDEPDFLEVDDERLRLGQAGVEQRAANLFRVVEVELSGERDDDRPVALVDSRDRRFAASGCSGVGQDLLLPWLVCGALRPLGHSSKNGQVELAEIAARAAGENFPVGSILFPRQLRPHIRALYCYARLVDELGDAYAGDRLAALDVLEREVGAAFAGEATWPVLRNVQPTIREFELPREPFSRLIEANRMDQRVSEYATWADVKHYCVHSADPCGRLVLGVLHLLDEPELVAASDSVCTGLQLVNFLQDVPRDLGLGRIYLPADDRHTFGDPPLDRPSEDLRALLRFEAARAKELLAAGEVLRDRIGGRLGRAVALFARGGLAALDALEQAGWDIFSGRPRPSRARLAREAALVLVR